MDKVTRAERKLANVCQLCSAKFYLNIKHVHKDVGHCCHKCWLNKTMEELAAVQPMPNNIMVDFCKALKEIEKDNG